MRHSIDSNPGTTLSHEHRVATRIATGIFVGAVLVGGAVAAHEDGREAVVSIVDSFQDNVDTARTEVAEYLFGGPLFEQE